MARRPPGPLGCGRPPPRSSPVSADPPHPGPGCPGRRHHVRHPVPRGEWRVGPLQHRNPRSTPARHRRSHPVKSGLQPSDQPVRRRRVPRVLAHRDDGRQHLPQGARVEGEHLRPAAQVDQRRVDSADVHGAHRAQVLGEDQIRIQLAQGVRVQAIQVLTGREPGPHLGVDLGWCQPRRQRRGRDDAPRPGLGGEVALKGDPDNIITRAEGEKNLGNRGQQRHNPHHPMLSATQPPPPTRRPPRYTNHPASDRRSELAAVPR